MNLALPLDVTLAFILIFSRIGSIMMLVPMIGEAFIPARMRLVLALFLSALLVTPLAIPLRQAVHSGNGLITTLLLEILIGLSIGVLARVLILSADMASQFAAQALGLSLGEILNPTYQTQSNVLGTFMSLLLVTVLFVSDAHHGVIMALAESYQTFIPGQTVQLGDILQLAVETVGQELSLALQIAAPFFVFGFLFNLGLGLLSRMLPQIQVTFLAVPLSVLAGMILLAVLLPILIDRLSASGLVVLSRMTGGG
jgi:flagellar biosynthesis protein FliR